MPSEPTSGTIERSCAGRTCAATYGVEGPFLIVESEFGTAKLVLGLLKPRTLAAKALKNLCEKSSCCGAPTEGAPPEPHPDLL